MRAIIRCPSCFTYVYDDAKACHGCGERIGRRKLLRRGSWVVIALIVCAYAAARGIKLHQDRQSRVRREFEAAERIEVVRGFLHAWLMADEVAVDSWISSRNPVCKEEMANLRDLYPTVLPATHVGKGLMLSEREQLHIQQNKGKVAHPGSYSDSEAEAKAKARLTATCEPARSAKWAKWAKSGSSEPSRRFVDGIVVDRTWLLRSVEFEIEFQKDETFYTLYGRVCLDQGGRDGTKVSCLTLDRVEGPEGTVPMEE